MLRNQLWFKLLRSHWPGIKSEFTLYSSKCLFIKEFYRGKYLILWGQGTVY